MKKIITILVAVAVLCTGALNVSAQATTTATSSAAVTAYIAQLQILRQLQLGMSGDDIKSLQAILAAQPGVYPQGIISGFYGPLTAQAVKKFQEQNGLEGVGRVGPKTIQKLNDLMNRADVGDKDDDDNGTSTNSRPCLAIPPGHLIAPGWLKKQGEGRGDKGEGKGRGEMRAISTSTVPCIRLPRKDDDHRGTSTPATTTVNVAPTLTSIIATSTASTSARITWVTNIASTAKVFYGTTTPVVGATSTQIASQSGFSFGHALILSNLNASTTYYYVVSSTAFQGLTATSSESSFVTVH